jgi:hypothetical protein
MPSLSQITISHGIVINVIFNTVIPLLITSEGPTENKRMWENYSYRKVIYFKLFGENCVKIMTAG